MPSCSLYPHVPVLASLASNFGYQLTLLLSVPTCPFWRLSLLVLTNFCIYCTRITFNFRPKTTLLRPSNLLATKFIPGTRLLFVIPGTGSPSCSLYPHVLDQASPRRGFLVPARPLALCTRHIIETPLIFKTKISRMKQTQKAAPFERFLISLLNIILNIPQSSHRILCSQPVSYHHS
jgi:hypothetical protein